MLILTEFEPQIVFKDFLFLYRFTEDYIDEETLKELMDFVDKFNVQDTYLLSIIEEYINYSLEEMVKNNDLDIDFRNHINFYHHPDGTPELEIDIKAIESEIYENIDSLLGDFNQSVLEKIDVNTSDVVSNLDIDSMAMSYLEGLDYDDERGNRGDFSPSYSTEDDIDAIFER